MHQPWPLWRRLLFRFLFPFMAITMAPWIWLDRTPGVKVVTGFFTKYYFDAIDWLVKKANALFFHIRPELLSLDPGSGDTSFSWGELCFYLSLSFLIMIVWSIVQRRKKEYVELNYWLCLFTRYFLSMVLFSYGFIKMFFLQMPFPSHSQLATPLGDLLPMRLSWLFIGYSRPYQFFGGLLETFAAVLLLYRRTVTAGVILATGVLINVAVLNLSYDIPVKIYSMQLVAYCSFLLANEGQRILCFFLYNKPANACTLYHFEFPKRWMKIGRVVLKSIFVVIAVGTVLFECIDRAKNKIAEMKNMAFEPGLYDVTQFVRNHDTLPPVSFEGQRWQNMSFDNNRLGSIATIDTTFTRYYNRAYFIYKVDTVQNLFTLYKKRSDTIPFASFQYKFADNNTIKFWGRKQKDSLFFTLMKNPHNFQLSERQFHWLSEKNR